MSVRVRKVCLLGDISVGKTSLIARYVHEEFSERYLTTVGVKTDTKRVSMPGGVQVKLVVWDIAGTTALDTLEHMFIRGAAGYLLVADGTRPETVEVATKLRTLLSAEHGDLPFVALLNKGDLHDQWLVDDEMLKEWHESGFSVMRTSAKTGENVEAAFEHLVMQMEIRGHDAS